MSLGGEAEMCLSGKLKNQAEETNPRKVHEDLQFSLMVLKTVGSHGESCCRTHFCHRTASKMDIFHIGGGKSE